MSKPDTPLSGLPLRAAIGYVLTHGRVTHGELTPRRVIGILDAKGVLEPALDDDPGGGPTDREGAVLVAEDVFAHRGLEYTGGDADE